MIGLSNTAKATMRFLRVVHAKTNGRCFYCGAHVRCADEDLPRDWLLVRSAHGLTMVPDHAHPKTRGGEDGADNRLPSCSGCNAAKGWLTVEEYRLAEGLKRRDLSFMFACEEPGPPRDWLCVYSEDEVRRLLLHNHPAARDAYSRSIPIRKRRKAAARR